MKVSFFAMLREIVGGKTIEVPVESGTTVRRLLDQLVVRHPGLQEQFFDGQGQFYQHMHVFVNGRDVVHLASGLETELAAGDDVKIFPPVGGG